MKKITQDEFLKTPLKGRGRSSPVYNEIYNLQPGEYLRIEKSDWKKRQPPGRVSSYIGKRTGRKYISSQILNDEGWIIQRVS